MKRILALTICMAILLAFTGCDKGEAPVETPLDTQTEVTDSQPEPDNSTASEPETDAQEETSDPAAEPEPTDEPDSPAAEKAFTFQPKVSSVYLEEIYGEDMIQTWFNYVDAVMAGEDTFECPDQWTHDWVIWQFPSECFPVLNELVTPSFEPVENGIGHIEYKTSREEFDRIMAEFAELVEDILNETMKPEYTDMEKALSLYSYFAKNYIYDYETEELLYEQSINDITSAYRLLTEGTGICHEISSAYSYLLMQAGVDATIMMGDAHQWSYVRINGNNYHIDPTFALVPPVTLQYFMMTDEARGWSINRDSFVVTSVYTQEYGAPDYSADDDTFSPVWFSYFDSFDHDTHTLKYYNFNEEISPEYAEFDYTGF